MATLSAMIGDRELSTMVSTTDLNVTTGKVRIAFTEFCICIVTEALQSCNTKYKSTVRWNNILQKH